jgi:hypothetical protein
MKNQFVMSNLLEPWTWTDSLEQMESSCEFGIEPSDSIKCWDGLLSSAQLHGVT